MCKHNILGTNRLCLSKRIVCNKSGWKAHEKEVFLTVKGMVLRCESISFAIQNHTFQAAR